jgi:pimeloyl-ACP methyl ester carboxylesterase
MERLSKLGFESRALGYSNKPQGASMFALGTVDDEVKAIARVSSEGTPPILVAHGVGSFVAQKYLESHPACGVVMIAPFPPYPDAPLKRLVGATTIQLLPDDTNQALVNLERLVKLEPDPSGLLRDAARPENVLNLEPLGRSMEVLLVSTHTDPMVTLRDLMALRNWHELLDDESRDLTFDGSNGHLTMAEAAWEAPGGISDRIVDWIDRGF